MAVTISALMGLGVPAATANALMAAYTAEGLVGGYAKLPPEKAKVIANGPRTVQAFLAAGIPVELANYLVANL